MKWLAENGPKTGYQLFAVDHVISNSTWHTESGNLSERLLIQPLLHLQDADSQQHIDAVRRYKEAKRKKIEFWLTYTGVGEALGAGADPMKVLHWIDKLHLQPDEERKCRFLVELCQSTGPDWTKEYMWEGSAAQWMDGTIAETVINLSFFLDGKKEMWDTIRSYPEVKTALLTFLKERLRTLENYINALDREE